MVTEKRINETSWKCVEEILKDGMIYRKYEGFIGCTKVFRKTRRREGTGSDPTCVHEWFIANGYYFANITHLCTYLNEKELEQKQDIRRENQFKYSLVV